MFLGLFGPLTSRTGAGFAGSAWPTPARRALRRTPPRTPWDLRGAPATESASKHAPSHRLTSIMTSTMMAHRHVPTHEENTQNTTPSWRHSTSVSRSSSPSLSSPRHRHHHRHRHCHPNPQRHPRLTFTLANSLTTTYTQGDGHSRRLCPLERGCRGDSVSSQQR